MKLKEFKSWLKYNPPSFGSADEWGAFDVGYKENAPIRYFLEHTVWMYFHLKYMRIRNIKFSLISKYYRKSHLIDTGLDSSWHDKDSLILHGMFNLLKDFVEQEIPVMSSNKDVNYKWYVPDFVTSKNYISRIIGEEHLHWGISLGDSNSPNYEQGHEEAHAKLGTTSQSQASREILELYLWWVDERPMRESVEYPDIPRDRGTLYIMSKSFKTDDPELYADWKSVGAQNRELTEKWDEEDTNMLHRLIDIRQALWT